MKGLEELIDIANNKTLKTLSSKYDLFGEDEMGSIYDIGTVNSRDIVFLLDLAEKYMNAKVSYKIPTGRFDPQDIIVKISKN